RSASAQVAPVRGQAGRSTANADTSLEALWKPQLPGLDQRHPQCFSQNPISSTQIRIRPTAARSRRDYASRRSLVRFRLAPWQEEPANEQVLGRVGAHPQLPSSHQRRTISTFSLDTAYSARSRSVACAAQPALAITLLISSARKARCVVVLMLPR